MESSFLLAVPSGTTIIVIVLAILILFGGKKIPELMKGLKQGIKEFKDESSDNNSKDKKE